VEASTPVTTRTSLGALLRPWSTEVAAWFDDVPAPFPLCDHRTAAAGVDRTAGSPTVPDDPDARIVVLAGPAAMAEAEALHSLAVHLGAPVANTWGAKGIYPWDDPHHMGTCGLQRDDFALLGFTDFDLVVAVGTDAAESPRERYALTETIELAVDREGFDRIRATTAKRTFTHEPNALYTRIAAIAQPGYGDESVPRHPARAVMDLKQSLGPETCVTAQPGEVGLWVARTFPTDRMGSVVVPAHDRPGIGAAVGLVSAVGGTETVTVVQGPPDAATGTVVELARAHDLPLRLEVWEDDVDWSRTRDLLAAAGPVVAWTG
jgi:thiamine pyrophosphate-dependent acetolactate synthase large subunit-like protein